MKQATKMLLIAVLCPAMLIGCGGAQARKAKYIEHGKIFYEQGNYDKAQLELKNAIQIDPKDPEARFLLGRVLEDKQEYAAAAGSYQALLNEHPEYVAAQVRLGRLYLLANAPEQAMKMVDVAIKQLPNDPGVLSLRGGVRARQGDIKGAMADGEAALSLDPANIDAISLLAGVYSHNGQAQKATALLRQAIVTSPKSVEARLLLAQIYVNEKDSDKAIIPLKDIIQLEPDNLSHRVRLASFYVNHNRLDEAEQVLREAATSSRSDDSKLVLLGFLAEKRSPEIAQKQLLDFIAANPNEYALRLELANMYQLSGHADKAKEVYRDVIKLDGVKPKGLVARTRLATLLAQEEKVADAELLINEVLKENPHDTDATALHGRIALSRRQPAVAIADFRSVLNAQPNDNEVIRLLGLAHMQNGEPAMALDQLQNSAKANPRDVETQLALGQVLMQTGDIGAAIRQFNAALELTPKDSVILESLFRAQLAKPDYSGAQLTIQRIRKNDPESAVAFYFSGLWKQAQKRYADSIPDFEAALKREPASTEILTALVTSQVAANQGERALTKLKQILVATPANALAYNLIGNVLLSQKKYPEAIDTFRRSIELNPAEPLNYQNLAAAYMSLQTPDKAENVFLEGVKATDGHPLLRMDLATFYQRNGKPDSAISQYDTLLARAPESQLAANNLAMLLVTYRDDAASLKKAGELVERLKNTTNAAYLDTLGWVRYRRGDFDGAVAALEQARKQTPNEPLVRYHLGMAYYKKGNVISARENLQQALNNKSNFRGYDDAKATLQKLPQS